MSQFYDKTARKPIVSNVSLKMEKMEDVSLEAVNALVLQDFDLQARKQMATEAEMLAYLSEAIAYMMTHKMDFLLSLLYRLDVAEAKINAALMPGNPDNAEMALAKLVWERQKQRLRTKKTYTASTPTTDKWQWDMD